MPKKIRRKSISKKTKKRKLLGGRRPSGKRRKTRRGGGWDKHTTQDENRALLEVMREYEPKSAEDLMDMKRREDLEEMLYNEAVDLSRAKIAAQAARERREKMKKDPASLYVPGKKGMLNKYYREMARQEYERQNPGFFTRMYNRGVDAYNFGKTFHRIGTLPLKNLSGYDE